MAAGVEATVVVLGRLSLSLMHHRLRQAMPCRVGETQEGYYQPLEKAELVREGGDVTILCYSRMRYVVMQAVQSLEKQGFDPEV